MRISKGAQRRAEKQAAHDRSITTYRADDINGIFERLAGWVVRLNRTLPHLTKEELRSMERAAQDAAMKRYLKEYGRG